MILLVSPSREELLADDGLNQYCIIIRTVVIANFFIDDAAEEHNNKKGIGDYLLVERFMSQYPIVMKNKLLKISIFSFYQRC